MGLLAAVCGLFLAILLSAEFGSQSSGPPAALKTVKTPTPDVAKLRPAAVHSENTQRVKRHRRAHRAKKPTPPPAAPAAVAQVQTPASTDPSYTRGYQQSSPPVQQLSAPSYPAPRPVAAPVKKPASRPKPSGSGGGTFDDSG